MANGDVPVEATVGWMSDVQRAIALILVGSFAIATLFATVCSIFWPDGPALIDMAKTLQAAMVNMTLIALGFFFGNTMAKMAQDAGQQKVVDKLTSNAPPPAGPVAPIPAQATVLVVPWWPSLMTEDERKAISAEALNDPKVQGFVTAATIGRATPDDLKYLVGKGLLTQDRATAIEAV